MPNLRQVDMMFLDDIFEMGGGYVLNFSNDTFSRFFADEVNVDIDAVAYSKDGGSKGKRLRCFLQTGDKQTVARSLEALWDYREAIRRRSGQEEKWAGAHGELKTIIGRLTGINPAQAKPPTGRKSQAAVDSARTANLRQELIALTGFTDFQSRGYAFEKFLKALFDAFGLEARDPFRLRGEQIDGSFILSNETYLLEAKWQSAPCGIEALHAFHGKVEQKAAWTRGLFISHSGFSVDGLHAFGRGKRVICMDGLDLYETLQRELALDLVLDCKVRRAAETGVAFLRVRDLF